MRELRFAVEHNPDYPSASRRTRQTAAEGVTLPRKRQGRSQPFGIVIGCVSPVLQGHRLANESANDPVSGSFLARGVDPTSAFMGRAMGETQADVHRCCFAKKATVCCNPAARGVVRHPSKGRNRTGTRHFQRIHFTYAWPNRLYFYNRRRDMFLF